MWYRRCVPLKGDGCLGLGAFSVEAGDVDSNGRTQGKDWLFCDMGCAFVRNQWTNDINGSWK